MLRILVGLAAGLALAIVTIMTIETIGSQISPPPRGFDMAGASAVAQPVANLIWPVIGWLLGSLLGCALAVYLSHRRWTGWAVAALVLAATIFNFALVTYPLWVMIGGVLAAILGGFLGQQLAQRSNRDAA